MSNEEETIEGFGTASSERKYDGARFQKMKTPDPKKGEESTEFVGRLLPPIKSLKDDEFGWRKYYGKHFGHPGNNPRNPDKPLPRPFGCIKEMNPRTKEIKVSCPKCEQIDKMKEKQDRRETALKAANPELDEKALKLLCKEDKEYRTYNEWLFKHSCDRAWWMNMMTPKGEFICFGISHSTMKDKLEPKLKEWRDVDKLDVFHPFKGVWIKFTRTGTKPRVTDTIDLVYDTVEVNGRKLKDVKPAPMTKDQCTRALKDVADGGACDLGKDVVRFLSSEKIQALLDSKGDLDKVDEIWDGPKKAKAASTKTSAGESLEDILGETEKTEEKVEAKPEPKTETKAVESDDEDLEAQMAALKAKAEAKAKAKAANETAAAAALTASTKSTESAEDFLANFDE